MNKAFNITGIALSVIFGVLIIYYIDEVSSARFNDFLSSYSSSSLYSTSSYSYSTYDSSSEVTEEAALYSLLFYLLFAGICIVNLLKIKTKTNKVISIIGISLTGIFLLWDIMMMGNSGGMSFDEIGPAFLFYTLFACAMCIVCLVQVGVDERKSKASSI